MRPAEARRAAARRSLRAGHGPVLTLDHAVSVFSQEVQVLAHGGMTRGTRVEVRGYTVVPAGGPAVVEAAGEPGENVRGRRGVEHGLGRLRRLVHEVSAAEGRRARRISRASWPRMTSTLVAGFGELAGDAGNRQGPRGGSDGDQDQG